MSRYVANWHGSALVRDTCLTLFVETGVWCETSRLLYPRGMPAEQLREANALRAKFLATQKKDEAA